MSTRMVGTERYILPPVEELRARFSYNPETGELRNKPGFKWLKAGFLQRRVQLKINSMMYVTSRVIWKIVTGEEPPVIVDHKDGNPVNFVWSNLRSATYLSNQHNKSYKEGSNRWGHPGIRQSGKNTWNAFIKVNRKVINLGVYRSVAAAIAARKAAEVEYRGEFRTTRVHRIYRRFPGITEHAS